MTILWVIASYILGSVPFGYLISRLSGKNVLRIGWRKTSGSNVFKNVGKWQGVATGLLDLAKGYLAVYGAKALGFSVEIQIFSGVAAVAGHNWSLFLRFAGGRGIGTFIGAFLAFSPQILFLSIVPLIILALIWDAAIGTLLFLAAAILISFYLNQFETAGVFTILSLVPILIKRLSPLKEIGTVENKKSLIASRLFFDEDTANWSLRIKRIAKPLAFPFLLPSKLGWRAAKFGVKMAKKPIEKWVFKNQEKVVMEIATDDFKKMMIAASKKIVLHQEEINRINVFPVADKDTGYNLAATLLGIEGVISPKNYSTFRELTQDIKEAAMINARGNAGMIYTGYLIELLDRIKHLETIDAFHLALAMKRGIKAARSSVTEPVEGTILDVIKTAGTKTFEFAKIKREKNIIKILKEAYKESLLALKETKEKLQVLKENDVVDAGALGFVKILEAWIESLKGVSIAANAETIPQVFLAETKGNLEYRYEVVSSFRKTPEINIKDLKEELSLLGNSLEVLELEDKVKIHIHTNEPESVQDKFRLFPEFGSRVEELLCSSSPFAVARVVEDMDKDSSSATRAQRRVEKNRMFFDSPRRALGLVVDGIADLPKDFLEKHDIVEISFTTSAPSFKEFLSAYQEAFEKFEKIMVITVSSKLSGAYSSARIARSIYKKPEKLNIYVFDCFTAGVGEGLVAIKAQALIDLGKDLEEIKEELKGFCPKVTLLGCIDDFRYAVAGGRFKLPKIFVRPVYFIQKIGIKFVVGFKNGKVIIFRASLGKNISQVLVKEIARQSRGKKIRVAIAHADNAQEAQKLKEEIEKIPGTKVVFVSSVSPAVAAHTGPGAVLVAFHPIDS